MLGKITARTGVEYGGRGGETHQRLVVARLREGATEHELRSVIAYCWHSTGLGWSEKADMRPYLRPETLFGPKTIAKYLAPARAWYAANFPDETVRVPDVPADVAPVLDLFKRKGAS